MIKLFVIKLLSIIWSISNCGNDNFNDRDIRVETKYDYRIYRDNNQTYIGNWEKDIIPTLYTFQCEKTLFFILIGFYQITLFIIFIYCVLKVILEIGFFINKYFI